MARKNLLSDLLGPATPAEAPPEAKAEAAPRARAGRGAIGAVSRSLADLKARSVLDLDPWSIDAGGLEDRLEHDAAEDAALARSIAEYGQQVPILVRPHPEAEGRYQIVYGRRRVLALRRLGQPVKALVRDLGDQALVMAQGQENTARRDLSFIEKARFALQMAAAGYDRKAICDALSVDKTVVSRMLSVAGRIPEEVIRFVGSAPGIGRDRWTLVADRIEAGHRDPGTLVDLIAARNRGDGPDSRFAALLAALGLDPGEGPAPAIDPPPARQPAPPSRPLRSAGGLRLGSVRATDRALLLRLDRARSQGFEDWLLDRLPDLHRDWLAARERS